MRKSLLIVSLLLGIAIVYGQEPPPINVTIASLDFKAKNVVPPSPEAASLGKYGNVPVSLFTGQPKVSIPLTDLKGNSLSLPVSLSYNASGFNPQEIASWVGLGWSLNAGGVITRSAIGNPDNASNYFISPSPLEVPNAIQDQFAYNDWLRDVQKGYKETQPDLYFYNVGNLSGKFTIKPDGTLFRKEKNNLKVTACVTCSPSYFTIVDESGITYEFNEVETSTYTTDDISTEVPVYTYTYPSSWYLSRIVSADGTEEILLDYTSPAAPHKQFVGFISNQSASYSSNGNGGYNGPGTSYSTPPEVSITKKYLQKVSLVRNAVTVGYVEFNTLENQRQDLESQFLSPGERLIDNIKVYRRSWRFETNLIQHYKFNYGYFVNTANPTWQRKRLRLESLDELPVEAGVTQKPAHIFEYNNIDDIPTIAAASTDHWGFLNGTETNTFVPTVQIDGNFFGLNANREPSLAGSMACQLKKIKYPTGGSTEFVYELNKATELGKTTEVSVGGIRLKQLIDYSFDNTKATVKTYEYKDEAGSTSGRILNLPQYYSVSSNTSYESCGGCGDATTVTSTSYTVTVSANSVMGLGRINGSHVGYQRVVEYQTDINSNQTLGKTVYEYRIEGPNDDDENIANGDLLRQTVYNNGGKLLMETTNEYDNLNITSIIGTKINAYSNQSNKTRLVKLDNGNGTYSYQWRHPVRGGSNCTVPTDCGPVVEERNYKQRLQGLSYLINLKQKRITQTITKVYDQASDQYIVGQKKYYYDNDLHTMPTRIEELSSGGEVVVTEKKYPLDYTISGTPDDLAKAIQLLQTKNIIGAEIESVQFRQNSDGSNKRAINGMLTLFEKTRPYPEWIYRTELSAPVNGFQLSTINNGVFAYQAAYKPLGKFTYNSYGNLVSQLKYQDVPKSYIWDYDYTLPVAEVTNASDAEIAYTGFETIIRGGWTVSSTGFTGGMQPGGYSGKNEFTVTTGTATITKSIAANTKQLVASYWSKNGAVSIASNAGAATVKQGVTYSGWTHYEHILPQNTTNITVTITGNTIDDLELFPKDAMMSTISYYPGVGVLSQTAPNAKAVFYEYDGYNRLINVKDQEGNIVKNVQYNYGLGAAFTNTVRTLFYNNDAFSDIARNNCINGAEPTTVRYTVPYGRYVSSVSQADADSKASSDIGLSAQAYANQYGECRFYSQQQSSTPTLRNNCYQPEAGQYFGPPIPSMTYVYVVPARKYYSLNSLADANQQAINDAENNRQAEANKYGSCTCTLPYQKWLYDGTQWRCDDALNTKRYTGEYIYHPGNNVGMRYECFYVYDFSDGTSSLPLSDFNPAPCGNQ